MPAYKTGKKTRQYSNEFKVGAVLMSCKPDRLIKDVAQSLDIHPFMLSRWRKEYFEGKLVADKRKIPADLKAIERPEQPPEPDRLKQLERENEALRMENDFLKKWQRFLAEQRRKGSRS